MERIFILLGALAAGLAVIGGAFGAHTLEGRVSPDRLETFTTGVTYQMYHALALLFVGWALTQWTAAPITWAGWCFLAGIVIFSGSLYALVLTDTSWLGAITPIGGIAFIIGWGLLAWGVWQGSV